jgi:pimeloyl-ACP methyl ester carboxylesterase
MPKFIRRRIWNAVLALVSLAAFGPASLLSPALAAEPRGEEFFVEANGVKLRVWEKFTGDPQGKPIIVLAHGSSSSGEESFDLQVPGKPGYSIMDALAAHGFDVYAPDMRGFGRSTRPEGGVSSADAADDLTAVISHILNLRTADKVNLLAWSWGTQYGGMFVMANPDKVSRYVSVAQMHVNSPDLARRRAKIEALRRKPYITIPADAWKRRFFSMTPGGYTDPDVIAAYTAKASTVETSTPTGPQVDMATLLPLVNPRLIAVPVMIIHGEFDDVADIEGLWPFFRDLPNPDKKYVVVPGAGHMIQFQLGHRQFENDIITFFKPVP